MESRAKTDKTIKELNAELKDREEVSKRASKEIERYNKIINDNLDMSSEKSEIINKLIELHNLIKIYNLNKIDNNLEANENITSASTRSDIRKLENRLRELSKKRQGHVYFAKRVNKIVNFFSTITYQ